MDEAGYAQLAELRAGLRGYLAWAEEQARARGLNPAQVQLALAIRAHPDPAGPTITDLSEALLLRHHSVVGLVDRGAAAGLVERARDADQPTRVHVTLTDHGHAHITALAVLHVAWLREHGAAIGQLWRAFDR